MILERFTNFVLRDRRQAIMAALLLSAIPFFSWIAAIIIALITLCKGISEGFIVLLWSVLPAVVLLVTHASFSWVTSVAFILSCLVVWGMAILFRRYNSLALVLELSGLAFIVVVLLVHLFVPNVSNWWIEHLSEAFKRLLDQMETTRIIPFEQLKPAIKWSSQFATGIQAIYLLFTGFVELSLARFLQVKTIRSKEFSREFLTLRLDSIATLIALVLVGLALYGPIAFRDTIPVILLPFVIAGLSLMHFFISRFNYLIVLTCYLFVFLIAIFIPVALNVLIIAAMMDSIFNFRIRKLTS